MRVFALGDPQARLDHVLAILDQRGLLDQGRLADDVVLISVGDHFDYPGDDDDRVGDEGIAVLEWLASHPSERCSILLGNHDLARVGELAGLDDQTFVRARELARRDPNAFAARHPELPPAGVLARDYSSFTLAQRELVQRLLLAGRMVLARVARHAGRPALLTHAGVTLRELDRLGLPDDASATTIAIALNSFLRERIDEVRSDWTRGGSTPLDLTPLHIHGGDGREGGGLLYHRPSHPERGEAWSFDVDRPRRFDPRNLPRGLVQVVGHTGAHKRAELGEWLGEMDDSGLRTLLVTDESVRYTTLLPHGVPTRAAILHMIDGTMAKADASTYELLQLEGPVE